MSRLDLEILVKQVTSYILAHPYERDVWEKAPAITGILRWEDSKAVASAKAWVDRAVDVQSTRGYLSYDEQIELAKGHVGVFSPTAALSSALGYCVLAYHERSNEARLLSCRRRHCLQRRAPAVADSGFGTKVRSCGSTSSI
jgi:unsaturated rhamnogalacturonyl hydrolase